MNSVIRRNIPNLITLGRLVCVPMVVWLVMTHRFDIALWLFIGAGISDAIDGYIAKTFDAETNLGGYLDPLADKALLVSVYLSLSYGGHLPLWLVILVVFRDITILVGAILFSLLGGKLEMEPLMVSKVNTTMQIVLATYVLAELAGVMSFLGGFDILVAATTLTTVLSGIAYVVKWSVKFSRMDEEDMQ